MSKWINNKDPTICFLQAIHLKYEDRYKLKVNRGRKTHHATTNQKRAGIAALILERSDFRVRDVITDKERHDLMIKGSVFQEDVTVLNI